MEKKEAAQCLVRGIPRYSSQLVGIVDELNAHTVAKRVMTGRGTLDAGTNGGVVSKTLEYEKGTAQE